MSDEAVTTRSFVRGMIHADGTLHADEMYDVGDAGGFTIHQLRLCVARLTKDGDFTQEGRGRRAVFRATPALRRELEREPEFLRLAFDQDAGRATWDGNWHLVTFSIPETRRTARNELRTTLVQLAGVPLGGLYVSANDWSPIVNETVERLQIEEYVTLASAQRLLVAGETDPAVLARRLWDLDGIADRWDDFIRRHRPLVGRLTRATKRADASIPADLVAATVRFAIAFDELMHDDPLLPPPLVPPAWPGTEARRMLVTVAGAIDAARGGHALPGLFSRFGDVIDESRRAG
jgi:phenylacetic acid degradation operon negative regulatory protein